MHKKLIDIITQSVNSILTYKDLIKQLTKRDVLERYKGSFLGLAWSFLYPLLMLLVYFFVFGIVFKMRWSGVDPSSGAGEIKQDVAFGTIMFAGLVIHSFFSEVFTRSPNLIINNIHYVKKIVFPLQLFSVVTLLTGLFHFLVGVFILLVFHIITGGTISWHIILLPVVLIPFLVFLVGLSWILSAFSVFFRDTAQITGVLSTVLLFLSPVFYPLSVVPVPYQYLLYFNPLTIPVEQVRQILIWNSVPDVLPLLIYSVFALIFYILGWIFFNRTRHMFSDVL